MKYLNLTLAPARRERFSNSILVLRLLCRELTKNNGSNSQRATDLLTCYRILVSMLLSIWKHYLKKEKKKENKTTRLH